MATAAALVIQANSFKFKWNEAHTIRLHPLRRSKDISLNSNNLRSCSPIRKDLKLKCFFLNSEKKPADYFTTTESKSKSGDSKRRPRNQPHVIANNIWESSLRALRKSAMGAVLLALLVMHNPKSNSALAAQIGRVGGSWYSIYGCNRYIINHDDPYPDDVAACYIFCFILAAFFVVLTSAFGDALWLKLKLIGLAAVLAILAWKDVRTNVVKLQVLVSDTGRALQTDLNRIAESVDGDTSSYKSLSYILNETVIALFRRHGYYISGYSSVASLTGGRAAKIYLNCLSINERIHHKETLVNVNNIKAQSSPSHSSANESHSEHIVVTILVAAKGRDHIPAIYDSDGLEKVLHILLSIGHSNRIRAVEVLWTPHFSTSAASICKLPASEVPL